MSCPLHKKRGACLLAALLLCLPSALSECLTNGRHRNRDCIIADLSVNTQETPPQVSTAEQLYAEPMPAALNAILLGEEFDTFDVEKSMAMQNAQKSHMAYQYFPHARDTFTNHLRGTWGILNSWGQSVEIGRAGLFHTAYGADLFIFSTLDPHAESSRQWLQSVIGDKAERLVWDFGSLAQTVVNNTIYESKESTIPAVGMMLESFVDGKARHVSARQLAKISVIRIADNLDQMVETNLWRDVHSHSVPSVLYPGAMKPAATLHWMTKLCKAVRGFLDVVPPVFDYCTSEMSYEEEVQARDLYWIATAEGQHLSNNEKVELLEKAASLNPFVAEPHVYLSELHLQAGRHQEGALAARRALKLFYAMGTQWDKRLPLRQWVNTVRMFLVRCVRSVEGKLGLPMSSMGVVLTMEVMHEFERVSPVIPFIMRQDKGSTVLDNGSDGTLVVSDRGESKDK